MTERNRVYFEAFLNALMESARYRELLSQHSPDSPHRAQIQRDLDAQQLIAFHAFDQAVNEASEAALNREMDIK